MNAQKNKWVVSFDALQEEDFALVGGKGHNLGRLTRSGFPVPSGFCVTTAAFDKWLLKDKTFQGFLTTIASFAQDELEAIAETGTALRKYLESREIPEDIARAIESQWRVAGEEHFYAVRSSATAEDLPDASFAGQQDTYLNIVGLESLLDAVRRCWASLYTDRAIVYRCQNGIPHEEVSLSVVVQRMVQPESSGILFTADPLSNHRKICTIDAGFGLGEALVSGLISSDLYKIHKESKEILELNIGDKHLEIVSLPDGGTEQRELEESRRKQQVLSESQIRELCEMAIRVEEMQGSPQDIEWCYEGATLYLVQSRPITSLYPLPAPAPNDSFDHLYFCFNHFQVMLDPMPAMAREMWRRIFPLGKKRVDDPEPSPLLLSAGNRLYVDFAPIFRIAPARKFFRFFLSRVDALALQALEQLMERPTFKKGPSIPKKQVLGFMLKMMRKVQYALWWQKPEGQTERLGRLLDDFVEEHRLRWEQTSSFSEFVSLYRQDITQVMPRLFFAIPPNIAAGGFALGLLYKLLPGKSDELAKLGRGLEGNVTTEMDLEVGDLADIARKTPLVVELLQDSDIRWEELQQRPEAREFVEAMTGFLEQYGSRGPSEIDISRERWRDRPESLLKTLAGNLSLGSSGSHRTHHQELKAEAENAMEELLKEAGRGFWGWIRKPLVKRLLRVHRGLFALREHPKFAIVRLLDLFRHEILKAGAELVSRQSLEVPEDIFFLETQEVEEALSSPGQRWLELVTSRKEEHRHHQTKFPPRVMSQDGEIPVARHSLEDVPEGALVGSPASSGIVEGVAKVILDPTKEVLHKGEILVAPFTDPGWTPLFINASGLVMEVGGQLTHGSVVAREYGIPAVVSVPDATTNIQTGQRIRVDGTRGVIEFLEEEKDAIQEESS